MTKLQTTENIQLVQSCRKTKIVLMYFILKVKVPRHTFSTSKGNGFSFSKERKRNLVQEYITSEAFLIEGY